MGNQSDLPVSMNRAAFLKFKKKILSLSKQTNQSCFSKSLRSDLPKIFVELEEADFSCSVCVCLCVCVYVFICVRERQRETEREGKAERERNQKASGRANTAHDFCFGSFTSKERGSKRKE